MKVVALTPDLADRSKVTAAVPGVVHVGAAALLAGAAEGADLVIVDLTRPGALDAVAALSPRTRVVAFGPHVDAELLAAATATGAEVLPRSRFFRLLEQGSFTPG